MTRLIAFAVLAAAVVTGLFWEYRRRHQDAVATQQAPAAPQQDAWIDDLYSRNPREVEAATAEVLRLGAAAIPAIQRVLHDPHAEPARLEGALKAAGILGPTAAPLVPDVAEMLLEPGLTEEAALALSHLGPDAFPALRDALRSSDPIVRREALRSIGKLKERAPLEASAVVPLLVARTKDEDPGVRAVAATYLGILHDDAASALPALVATLADADAEVRRVSAAALGAFPPDVAAPALPALRKALRDPNPEVSREAGQAIVKLQGK